MKNKCKEILRNPYNILWIIAIYTLVFGLISDSIPNIITGFIKIISIRGMLITDYIAVGGVGATLLNVSLSCALILTIYRKVQLKATGSLIMAFWLCFGFSFFGKNVFNMMPIIFGGYLYSRYKKEDFMWYTLTSVLSTSLAPAVNEFYYIGVFKAPVLNFIFAIVIGICIGFIMIPISINAMKAHSGFNLYNVGFAAGILGLLIMGIIRGLGLDQVEQQIYWSDDKTILMATYIIIICLFLITMGLFMAKDPRLHLKKIYKSSGRLVSDYYLAHKESVYINMGLLGLFVTILVILLGGDINGPTLGGIFTVIGFGCFGKHLKNVFPVMTGAILAGFLCQWEVSSPNIILAIIFSAGLAPIAGTFSTKIWKIPFNDGIIAGMLHIFVVTNVGTVHGGLNLYNNGFAAGFVAMILVPIITNFREGDFN
ncbi:MAG: DUF1576 domain-containing protein [Lachnospirales bacterium]